MPNHLMNETSPYLKQHKENPVDWYPWGDLALNKAKKEDKPIFLSIGYAACHWCHVMAHESFENEKTAEILNEHFVSIKVDREERPDLDEIYMQSVVLLTGQGGWPMSVFLTPELKPFFGGTYFPPIPRQGMHSFNQVLLSVIGVWQNKRETVQSNASIITNAIQSQFTFEQTHLVQLDLESVVDSLVQIYDWKDGGWGKAPKFPQPMVIEFLIQRALGGSQKASKLVNHILDHMARGGMYDLVGGGFHRYSTDNRWLIPHFEKMLYDNAQLALVYLHGYSLTGNTYYRYIAVRTLEFIQREMSHPDGGFYASLDADTPEGEGRYYSWRIDQLKNILSPENFSFLNALVSLNKNGNFESNLNVLQLKNNIADLATEIQTPIDQLLDQLDTILRQLAIVRSTRTPPRRDEKIITDWNALAIRAFAAAGLMLNRDDFLVSARKAMTFILEHIQTRNGHLYRTWGEGKASQPGILSDYAGMILALHAIYEVDFHPDVFQEMKNLFQIVQEQFSSIEGLYFDTAENVSHLIIRPKSVTDNALPSGNALAGNVHWLLANYQEDTDHNDRLSLMLSLIAQKAQQYPTSFGAWLSLADRFQNPTTQVAIISDNDALSLKPFLNIYRQSYRPNHIIAAKYKRTQNQMGDPVLLHNRETLDGKTTAYICQGFTCQQPLTQIEAFRKQLEEDGIREQ